MHSECILTVYECGSILLCLMISAILIIKTMFACSRNLGSLYGLAQNGTRWHAHARNRAHKRAVATRKFSLTNVIFAATLTFELISCFHVQSSSPVCSFPCYSNFWNHIAPLCTVVLAGMCLRRLNTPVQLFYIGYIFLKTRVWRRPHALLQFSSFHKC